MSLPQELRAKLAAESSPTRSQLMSRTVLGLGIAVTAAAGIALRNGPNAGARAPMFMGAIALILLMFAARALFAGMSTSMWVSPANAKRLVIMPYVALAAVALAYSRGPTLPHSFAGDVPCAAKTLLLASIIGVALLIVRRRTEPIRPTLKAFLFGAFAATVAALLVFLACPLEEARHFAFAHLGGALIAGGCLGAIASRVIRV